MSVPDQVKKQSAAVQALYDDVNSPAPSPEGEGVESTPVVAVVPPADGAQEPGVVPVVTEPAPGAGEESFEQRYNTLQGMYNSQVPQLQQNNTALQERVEHLESLISTLATQPTPSAASTVQPIAVTSPVNTLTEGEIEEYGESIGIMRKVSEEIAGPYQQQIADLTNQLAQLQGIVPRVAQIGAAQAQSADQVYWSELTRLVPNWQEINALPEFQAWLLETDMLSGLTRQTYLEDAQNQLDVTRTAGFFTSWPHSTGTVIAQPNAATSELEQQVVPGKSVGGGVAPNPAEEKSFTPEQITQFYRDVREGKFKGKEDDRNTIERDIFAAQAGSRIVNA